jgi:hypothetical protein
VQEKLVAVESELESALQQHTKVLDENMKLQSDKAQIEEHHNETLRSTNKQLMHDKLQIQNELNMNEIHLQQVNKDIARMCERVAISNDGNWCDNIVEHVEQLKQRILVLTADADNQIQVGLWFSLQIQVSGNYKATLQYMYIRNRQHNVCKHARGESFNQGANCTLTVASSTSTD